MGVPVDISDVKKRFDSEFLQPAPLYRMRPKIKTKPGECPQWLVISATDRKAADRMEKRLERFQLATVCQSAHLPQPGRML